VVYLEVPGMDDNPQRGAYLKGEAFGDGMGHPDELESEGAQFDPVAGFHREKVGLDPLLLELFLDQGQGEG